jgi:hypothetical protein
MIIANPIYDVVFKRLMEDKRIARFFVETLTGESITEIDLKPQEFTYNDRPAGIAVYRLDFIATIKTARGYKKVLIEIQKAKNAVDLMRFRNYLAEQYKNEDEVVLETGKTKMALPLITIYLLGFRLNEIESSVIKVDRQYIDLITKEVLDQKSDFIEKLTHDSYVVQIPRIQPRLQSRLEMLLTIFEQNHFTDEREITKNYTYQVNDEYIKDIVEILHHAGTDPDKRVEIEKEQEALRVYDLGMGELKKTIAEKDKAIAENEKVIAENEKTISEKDKALTEKDKALAEKERLIEELKRRLGEE